MAESIVTLRVEARNAISSLNRTSQATKTLSKSANGATASLTAASTAAKGLGASLAASLGPLLTVGAAFATVGNAIGTFTARERDVAILNQGLKNLGAGTAQLNELEKAADRLGNQTLFNQEEFTRGFNLLTSFRNIGVDSYERVAQAAADIAQVNQVDVSTSFMQLAKALQDPERNLSNLNRSGIAFTKQQTEVIKQLMKTNKTAEAHAMILRIVGESYNKLAQAAAEGFAGNVDSLGEAFRDFSETLGKALEPVLISITKGLTKLIRAVDDLFNSPLGQTAGIFAAIALAAKGVAVGLPLVALGLQKVAYAGGLAAAALNAIPFVAIASTIGFVTTALIQKNKEQKKYNQLIKEGGKKELQTAILVLEAEKSKVASQRRGTGFQKDRLKLLDEEIAKLQERLNLLNNENKLQDEGKNKIKEKEEAAEKLKEKFKQIGQAVEQGIVENLTDAVMGTKTLAEAAINVLNQLKRKLIELAIQRAVSGIGNFIGNTLISAFTGGGGGKLASSAALGKAASKATGIPMNLPKGSFNITPKAVGGPVSAGGSYLVGERGPEILQMGSRGGNIIPNNAIGGGNTTNNMITVNVDASGTSVQGSGSEAEQLGGLIASVVQATIIDEQRAGGLLNR